MISSCIDLYEKAEEENDTETSTELAYWFILQASDDLLSEEEKEQQQL